MADQQPAFTAYAVTKREGKDDWWTPIGAAFPHKDGTGYNIVPQTIPLDGKSSYGRRRRGRRRTARNESGRRFARKTTGGVLKAAHGDI